MKTDRRPDIQGLRAIAVLSVVGFHGALPIPGGFSGVDIFFVISGFVITTIITREIGISGNFQYLRFYLRRSKRLLPALSVVVSFTLVISIFLSPLGEQQNTSKTAIGSVFSVANVVIAVITGGYFDLPAEMNPLLHTWSLSVEEQFYLVFPFLLATGLIFSLRKGFKFGWPTLLLISIFLISFSSALIFSNFELEPKFETLLGFYSPISRAWEFSAGALIAILHIRFADKITTRAHERWSAFGLILLATTLFLVSESTPWPGFWTLLPVAGTCMLLFSANFGNSISLRALRSKVAVLLGDLSYSIYLWHWPVIVYFSIAFPEKETAFYGALFSLLPATASYYLLENKFRRSPIKSAKKTGFTLLAFVAIPSLIGLAVFTGANKGWGIQWDNLATIKSHVALANCTDKKFDPEKCTWTVGSGKRILLVGDSQAYFWADGVIPAAKELGYEVNMSEVKSKLKMHIASLFNMNLI